MSGASGSNAVAEAPVSMALGLSSACVQAAGTAASSSTNSMVHHPRATQRQPHATVMQATTPGNDEYVVTKLPWKLLRAQTAQVAHVHG